MNPSPSHPKRAKTAHHWGPRLRQAQGSELCLQKKQISPQDEDGLGIAKIAKIAQKI
jgi:hypothetical protein